MCDDPDLKRGISHCKDALGGVWATLSVADVEVSPISGGLTNYLYLCSLPSGVEPLNGEPRCVLLRIYGDIAKTSKEFVVHSSVVFALLSEKGMGPKLYGMYPEGRVEEYIPTKCLAREDLPKLFVEVARKLAQFHILDMPLCKDPRWLLDTIGGWLKEVDNNLTLDKCKKDEFVTKLRSFNLTQEYDILKEALSSVYSPVVFSHNDLQEGNILYFENCMTVIDWEYCSYNYRGFDLGNHFCEWSFGYSNPNHPYFFDVPEDYPSKEQQFKFFEEYLKETEKYNWPKCDLDQMYVEVNTYALASHFLWGLWSILQNKMSHIEFGYMEYAVARFERYFELKEMLKGLQQT
ncbi:hypothetical protein ScPMuIL_015965 [Solemya velum]